MNDNDYLWDKTGEPDPEVQQLEELLGTLRYQPQPLEIPAGLQVGSERSFFRKSAPQLAIAATIVMLLLGLGLWLGLQRLQRTEAPEIVKTGKTPVINPSPGINPNPVVNPNPAATPAPDQNQNTALKDDGPERIEAPRRHRVNQSLAGNSYRNRNASLRNQQLAANKQRDQAEKQKAEAAKDQLMLALRVASAKFGFAQRKAQGLNQKDQVHNQHKTG